VFCMWFSFNVAHCMIGFCGPSAVQLTH
jgi:hypothetical protein